MIENNMIIIMQKLSGSVKENAIIFYRKKKRSYEITNMMQITIKNNNITK